jgi:hypothetical protein
MMTLQATLSAKWADAAGRHPFLRLVAKWGIPAASLIGGIATLLLFRRGLDFVPWIIGYVLLLWLAGVVFAQARQSFEAKGRRLVVLAYDLTIQNFYQDLFLFLLPIYYASTTVTSANVWVFLLMVAGALVTTIDPWYQVTVVRYRWAGRLFFTFALFVSLNVALPLIRVRPGWALTLAGLLSALALFPAFRMPERSWRDVGLRVAALAVLVVSLLWWARDWIPPAPLHLAKATCARAVADLAPVDPVSTASASDLQAWGGLSCYTAVYAPSGLREEIYHLWKKDGRTITTVALSPIKGGRAEGFRTYSRKSDFGPNPAGRWRVDVLTSSGQLIGRVRFAITP